MLAGSLALTPGLLVVFVLSNGLVAVVAVTLAGALIVSGFGLTTFTLGVLADSLNLRVALLMTAAAPAVGALVALWLPRQPARRAYAAQAAG